jgi:hypothetical protein
MRFRSVLLLAVAFTATRVAIAADNPDESRAIRAIEWLGGQFKRDNKLPGRPVVLVQRKMEFWPIVVSDF